MDKVRKMSLHAMREALQEARQEQQHQRERTPTIAVQDFEGNVHTVRAHRMACCPMTRGFLTFLLHSLVLIGALIVGLTMTIITKAQQPVWTSLVTLSLGGFFPAPKYKKAVPYEASALPV